MKVLRETLARIEAATGHDETILQMLGLREYVGTDSARGKPRKVIREPVVTPCDSPGEEDLSLPVEVDTLGKRFLYNREAS